MWQQRASYEQSNVMDVTIQCQFNIAAKNMAEFSTMFASPAPNRQAPGQSTNDCQTFYNTTYDTPTRYRSQCDFEGYQPQYDYRNFRTINQTNTQPPSPEMTPTSPPAFQHHHVNKPDFMNVNQFLDDSGYSSPLMNHTRQLPVSVSASSSPMYCPAAEEFSKSRVSPNSPSDQWYYSQCNYGYNQRQNQPEVPVTPPVKAADDHCEEMKLAMREKDVTHRLFVLRERNKDASDEIEQYYQSQTALIDIERHNILCQMAYDSDSTQSINTYYNMKLVTLLESVEQKLSAFESETSTKTAKKCVVNQKKSRLLPKHSVKILESWYQENLENPYPSRDVTLNMASEGGISVEQIRKWFANKRNRSRNSKLKKGLLDDCE